MKNHEYAYKIVSILDKAQFDIKIASGDIKPDDIDERIKDLYYRLIDLVHDAKQVELDLLEEASPWHKK